MKKLDMDRIKENLYMHIMIVIKMFAINLRV